MSSTIITKPSFCKALRDTFSGRSGQSITPFRSIINSGITSLILSAINTWLDPKGQQGEDKDAAAQGDNAQESGKSEGRNSSVKSSASFFNSSASSAPTSSLNVSVRSESIRWKRILSLQQGEDKDAAAQGDNAQESGKSEGTSSDSSDTSEKEPKKDVIYYVTDEQQQSQYVRMFKEQGIDAVIPFLMRENILY